MGVEILTEVFTGRALVSSEAAAGVVSALPNDALDTMLLSMGEEPLQDPSSEGLEGQVVDAFKLEDGRERLAQAIRGLGDDMWRIALRGMFEDDMGSRLTACRDDNRTGFPLEACGNDNLTACGNDNLTACGNDMQGIAEVAAAKLLSGDVEAPPVELLAIPIAATDDVGAAWQIAIHWRELGKLAAATDRATFSAAAREIIRTAQYHVLDMMLGGKSIEGSMGWLTDFINGVGGTITALNKLKQVADVSWTGSDTENSFDKNVTQMFDELRKAIKGILDGEVPPRLIRLFILIGEPEGSLAKAIYGAAFTDFAKARDAGIEINIDIPSSVVIGNTDHLRTIENAVEELICNAIKYCDLSKERKWIKISWSEKNGVIRVSDNGLGIKDTKAVFRGGREHPEIEGTGYGLRFVRDSLGEIGWKFYLTSTLGEGTSFYLISSRESLQAGPEAPKISLPTVDGPLPDVMAEIRAFMPDARLGNMLDHAWERYQNPPLPKNFGELSALLMRPDLDPNVFQRLSTHLDILIADRVAAGKKLENIVVCVAAHGDIDPFGLRLLVAKGVKVVSRERAGIEVLMLLNYPDLADAVKRGQLIFSAYTGPHPDVTYDISIWSHPDSHIPESVQSVIATQTGLKFENMPFETIVENLGPGGLLLLQTDQPKHYIDKVLESGLGFREEWQRRDLTNDSYLMPSNHLNEGAEMTGVAVMRRTTR